MKKTLLVSVSTFVFSIPAFCAFPGSDMNNDGQVENHVISSNMRPMHMSDRYGDPTEKKQSQQAIADTNQANSNESMASDIGQEHSQREKIDERNMQALATDDQSGDLSSNATVDEKKRSSINQKKTNTSNADDTENANLADLSTPAPRNIRNNLSITDEDRALNRQMMVGGPQGGFQNSQPRGIGGTSAY